MNRDHSGTGDDGALGVGDDSGDGARRPPCASTSDVAVTATNAAAAIAPTNRNSFFIPILLTVFWAVELRNSAVAL
jgi:hypothetical protein